MNDKTDTTKNSTKSTLTLSDKLTLSKPIASSESTVQKISQGRQKNDVAVEVTVMKKRRFVRNEKGEIVSSVSQAKKEESEIGNIPSTDSDADQSLTEDERNLHLQLVQRAEEEKRLKEEADEQKPVVELAQEEAVDPNESDQLPTEGEESEIDVELSVDPLISIEPVIEPVVVPVKEHHTGKGKKQEGDKGEEDRAPVKNKRALVEEKKRAGKVRVTQIAEQDEVKTAVRDTRPQKRERKRTRSKSDIDQLPDKIFHEVIIPEVITVAELANRMAERVGNVMTSLMKMGVMTSVNEPIDGDTAQLIVEEFGHKVRRVAEGDIEEKIVDEALWNDNLQQRPPVVTIMGHVDHGKTSLLDALRKTDTTAGEAGGITQHIGAYQITIDSGTEITFLDTPGHQAFTEMRARGANATDIVVLVVAADDGIMEQTIEAINHAKAAEVPIIVAINKIDRPAADPTKVINELLSHELVAESLGGDIMTVEVSAKEGTNLEKLIEGILLQAEIMELKANPSCPPAGVVIESKIVKGKGPVATILVQHGTLRVGDIIVAGTAFGKVRSIIDDRGKSLQEASPSSPVEISGLDDAPLAGSPAQVVQDERRAREVVEFRKKQASTSRLQVKTRTLEDLFSQGDVTELPVLIKADVQGSVEAIASNLQGLSTDEVEVRILHAAVGGITESDVALAEASKAIILGFNVRASNQAKSLAEKEGVSIRYYNVIYNIEDDIKAALSGLLEPTFQEVPLGQAEIREVYSVSKMGKVAGGYVSQGVLKRNANIRLLRDNIVIYEGKLKSLKRFKDDVKEVGTNFECGFSIENYDDIKVGDIIEAYEVKQTDRFIE